MFPMSRQPLIHIYASVINTHIKQHTKSNLNNTVQNTIKKLDMLLSNKFEILLSCHSVGNSLPDQF